MSATGTTAKSRVGHRLRGELGITIDSLRNVYYHCGICNRRAYFAPVSGLAAAFCHRPPNSTSCIRYSLGYFQRYRLLGENRNKVIQTTRRTTSIAIPSAATLVTSELAN